MQNNIAMALAILCGFSGYMRLRELTSLMVGQLISPSPLGGHHFRFWTVVLHPEAEGIRSKSGTFDDSVHLDANYLCDWAGPFLTLLIRTRGPDSPLWPFTHTAT